MSDVPAIGPGAEPYTHAEGTLLLQCQRGCKCFALVSSGPDHKPNLNRKSVPKSCKCACHAIHRFIEKAAS